MLRLKFYKLLHFLHILSKEEYKKKSAPYKYRLSPEYKAIAKSKLFDKWWYLEHNPDVAKAGKDPIEHYLKYGWKNEKRQTTPYFDEKKYAEMYPDVKEANVPPLLHYIQFGAPENRQAPLLEYKRPSWWERMKKSHQKEEIKIVETSQFFDEEWYLKQYPSIKNSDLSPAQHYASVGWKEGKNPSKDFNTKEYLEKYPECKICPLVFEHNRNEYTDLSICAIMKNEAPYVKEWIDYHRLVGVKRFYIYDNESEDNLKEVLTPYIEQGIVVYKYYPGKNKQMIAYAECCQDYQDKTEWLSLTDTDEFIIPVVDKDIPSFLQKYKAYPAVCINMIYYDSNKHEIRPQGGVLENYIRLEYDLEKRSDNHQLKCIVQPSLVVSVPSCHFYNYKDNRWGVTENFQEIKAEKNNVRARQFSNYVSINKIRINHYYCKSREEAQAKVARGDITRKVGDLKPISSEELNFTDYKYDYSIYMYLIRMKPEIAVRETIKYLYLTILNIGIICKHLFTRCMLQDYIDSKWYLKKYPEAKKQEISALEHYMTIGWKLGYNPSKYFDTNFYLTKYPDIKKAGVNPLRHYLNHGKKEGRLAKPVSQNILKYILTCKTKEPEKKSVKTTDKKYQLLANSELFDKKWYCAHYLKGKNEDPINHYLTVGWKEGKNPSAKFDGNAYLQKYQDVKNAGVNPLVHYLQYGKDEGRQYFAKQSLWQRFFHPYTEKSDDYRLIAKSKYFDKKWYLQQNPDVAKAEKDPIEHYLKYGWKEGRNPSLSFDGQAYLERYFDVRSANINPLLHYEKHGKYEKRILKVNYGWTLNFCRFIHQFRKDKKHKKVLLISHELTYTGAPLSLLQIAQTLKNLGYEIVTISLKKGLLGKEFKKIGKFYITKNIKQTLRHAAFCDIAIANTLATYEEYNAVSKLIPTAWMCREPHSYLEKNIIMRRIFEHAENIYCMSEFSRQEFLPYNSNINVIKHGFIDKFEHFQKNNNLKKINFAIIGSIDERKGQDILLKAIRLLDDKIKRKTKFYIIGKCLNKKYFEELSLKKYKNVEHIKEISDFNDMLHFYQKISCVIIPSREEPTSRVAIEAMMMGIPVIMSSHVGAQYLLNGKNGFMFENENSAELAKIISDIVNNSSQLKKMAKEARQAYLKNNEISVFTQEIAKLMKGLEEKIIDNRKLLVHLHLFYHDQLDYFLGKLKNITCDYDLFVTICEDNVETIQKLKSFKENVHILKVPNRGYDVYPFWLVLQEVNLDNYSYVLKIHTKNHRNEKYINENISFIGNDWRNALVDALLKNKKTFQQNLKMLENVEIGMIGCKNLIKNPSTSNDKNFKVHLQAILENKIHKKVSERPFICGTMFLVKTKVLETFKNTIFSADDFVLQSDTGNLFSLAHALERYMGILVYENGKIIKGVQDNYFKFCKARIYNLFYYINPSHIFQQYHLTHRSNYDFIRKSKFFNREWYLNQNPDIKSHRIDPVDHYLNHGWKEERNPSPKFDGNGYLEKYQDIKTANICPLLHYEKFGKYEGRQVKNFSSNPISIQKGGLNYRSYQNLVEDIRHNASKIKEDIDLVVGIPRSGMIPAYILGQYFNCNVCSVDEFENQLFGQKGMTRKMKSSIIRNIIVIDDSINSGKSLLQIKERLQKYEKLGILSTI